ncbi:MAG TPA: (2Fe-2S)-binding protein [Methylocystis sp.]|nr:(2Fe-2S)-binding protein [Methylocystis sp.]
MLHKELKSKALYNVSKLGGAMIVCSCNVVSDREVRGLLGPASARPSVGAVFRNLGCSVQCGRCARSIAAIVEQHCLRGGCDEEECSGCGEEQAGGLAA